jgi:hypothetical protein
VDGADTVVITRAPAPVAAGPGVADQRGIDVTEPTWLPYATFGVSVLAAGGASWAAIIAGKLNRKEGERNRQFNEAEARRSRAWNELQSDLSRAEGRVEVDRTWERDRVTEHYLALLRATNELSMCYTERVVPAYASTPVGDLNAVWAELTAAHGRLLQRMSEAMVVARQGVMPHIGLLADIDLLVMVPFARSHGAPPLANQRAEREHHVLVERTLSLTFAMRADLGLATGDEAQRLADAVGRADRQADRSLARADDPDELRRVLQQLQVQPLMGARPDLLIDGTALSGYQLPLASLRRPVAALLLISGEVLATGLADDLDIQLEIATLQDLVRYVESGLRDGPGQRDAPGGGRVVAWFR